MKKNLLILTIFAIATTVSFSQKKNLTSAIMIAKAKKPFQMALAFKNGVIAGRQSFLAGRIEKSLYGSASSPTSGII